MKRWCLVLCGCVVAWCLAGASFAQTTVPKSWRDASFRSTLRNNALEASFQSGLLYQLKDVSTGEVLLSVNPDKLLSKLPVFGMKSVDLDAFTVTASSTRSSVSSRFRAKDGTELRFKWRTERGTGDLVLTSSATSPELVAEMRFVLFGCDIVKHKLVGVDSTGTGRQFRAPWDGTFVGDPEREGSPMSGPAPLVLLFEGEKSGWVIEGRDLRIGPSNTTARGYGDTANVGLICHFPIPAKTPKMFEIRLRAYKGRWETAVDPFTKWMEKSAGYTPISKLPRERAWVKDVDIQAYVTLGDFQGLDDLAKRVNPKRTFLGRFYGWRVNGDIMDLPDYHMSEMAKKWFRHAADLGFHVGAGFSAFLVSANRPDLVEKFRPGFAEIGKDKDGKPIYHTLPPSPSDVLWVYYCTPALKAYRDYFVEHVKDAVDAGADVIYLDEAAWPCGKSVVDGMDSIQGVIQLEKDILARYPHVAIETEQFNPVAGRHLQFGLSQMYLGHPLGGYIFSTFIKIAPEGYMHGPTEGQDLDGFQSYGYIMPGVSREESWLQIGKAFQDYQLRPDYTLSPQTFDSFKPDRSGGAVPVFAPQPPEKQARLFGYRGRDGVTAYYEKYQNKQGLVVYEPGKEPKWFGARVTGLRTWPGPGSLKEWMHPGAAHAEVDWFMYDGPTQIGLNSNITYRLDESTMLPADRFHVTSVPDDFALDNRYPTYLRPQEIGFDGSFYKLIFSGSGNVRMFVPEDVLVFVDGNEVAVDRANKTATVQVAATKDKPSALTAFPRVETQLVGKLMDLPWKAPPLQRTYFITAPVAGGENLFHCAVTAIMVVSGKLPQAKNIHIKGGYRLTDDTHVATTADGVIRINGKEIVREAPGERPFKLKPFDVDLSEYAGQNVLIEIVPDGVFLAAPAECEWHDVQIVAEN